MPWIHVEDASGLILRALTEKSMRGAINLVAPEAVTNATFTQALAEALKRPAFCHAPAFALRLLLRGMADEMFLGSQRVNPRVAAELGYHFAHPTLSSALQALV
jgi:NAD dependent epimerase/dehydratase family enzyme